ncbi:recombination regulator RecX [Burkholderia vietnamiensis]|jgi:regulatory protein|uniref:Regulatory protein RecX n=1 Tax=Burkholderia vietnamiensis (strain G4 / LMG 22486) TaxID=269482 RepID=A4JHK0_BURVG|nr:recombination regulator RecX [Burkholderia vietnamiensis]ABO55753.1 regulatory protein RecX [Burkholderia vietnamiensis G4]KVF30583.1 recombinase RecX [Burkholderia vietnamiensis]MBR8280642.1 recombination regulator RecX [Burkholderia vietnamiensis]MCA8194645.1 recombination regulator RecX [Burkholderia vietnamiensis]MCB4345515.1 recombination regulator RecX [Burkholderia vietnamiensis]
MAGRRGQAGEPEASVTSDVTGRSGRRAASSGTDRRSAGSRAAHRTETRASDDALVSFEIAPPVDPFDDDESFDAHDRSRRRVSGIGILGARAADAAAPVTEDVYTRSSQHPRRTRRASGGAAGEPSATAERKSSKPPRSLKGRALGYLSRREYSRAELARKLAPYVGEDESVELVLDALEQEGWLSDARFAESLVHRRASRVGVARIVSELKRHAVGDTLVEEVNAQLRETELTRAQAVWRKKFGALPQTPAERAKQARFLAARGFSSATIVKLLKAGDDLPIDD